ncbi:MAG TPA: hypothetical protein VKZ54_10735 [Membranihabitans sp.]|nr:hypothetical protein [Membranihabitans sp.]
MTELGILPSKIAKYQEVLKNTETYRKDWEDTTKDKIIKSLESLISETSLSAEIEIRDGLKNLESVVLSLGVVPSGIYEPVGDKFKKKLYKSNGMLIFQQLYNGKIIVMMGYPHIEEVANPKPPKTLEIIRPEELTDGYMLRYLETFFTEIIGWEDYDDDIPQKIGFNAGFQNNSLLQESKG